jgi:DNA-3-methyladenine glycosylase I
METEGVKMKTRCYWAGTEPMYVAYHDAEWGTPVHDDYTLFEFLVLEGAQAGLSWRTILQRRENYRKAFAGFDPLKVAEFDQGEITRLLENPGIIRNKLKINSAVKNAKAFLKIQQEFGSFDKFIWAYVDQKPILNAWETGSQIPDKTELSTQISKDLKKHGFSFVGPTIIYAYMQAVGMVNDHIVSCFRYQELGGKKPG